jgi:hypothetical protein
MGDKCRYVIPAVSQRGHFDRKDTQSIEEIFTEATLVDLLPQVPIACRDDTYINFARAGGRRLFSRFDRQEHPAQQRGHLVQLLTLNFDSSRFVQVFVKF